MITYTNYIDLNDTFFLFSPDLISKLKSNSKISKNVPFYLFIVELPHHLYCVINTFTASLCDYTGLCHCNFIVSVIFL